MTDPEGTCPACGETVAWDVENDYPEDGCGHEGFECGCGRFTSLCLTIGGACQECAGAGDDRVGVLGKQEVLS